MKLPLLFLVALAPCVSLFAAEPARTVSIFDGKTFKGWEGDTNKIWRVQDGALVGGSLKETVPHNEFLRTTRSYTNFILRLQVKLVGAGGFINAGVQVRSKPVTNPPYELSGYQCDMGDGWWGKLYDESRRNKVLIEPKEEAVARALKKNDWNTYEIRCDGKRIQTSLNGVPMIDYTEPDDAIEQFGIIGLQIHGGGKAEASYKDIVVTELP